jgi:hypothetical protein
MNHVHLMTTSHGALPLHLSPAHPYATPGPYDYPPSGSRNPYFHYQAPHDSSNQMRPRYDEHEPVPFISRHSAPPSLSRSKAFRISYTSDIRRGRRVHSGQPQSNPQDGGDPYNESNGSNTRQDECDQRYPMIPPVAEQTMDDTGYSQAMDEDRRKIRASGAIAPSTTQPPASAYERTENSTSDGSLYVAYKLGVQGMSDMYPNSCVGDVEPSSPRRSVRGSAKDDLPYTQDSHMVSEEIKESTRFNIVDDEMDQVYMEVESTPDNMNAPLSQFVDSLDGNAGRRARTYDGTHHDGDESSEYSDTEGDNRGFVPLEDIPRRLRNIMLSRKPTVIGLDVDIGLNRAILHIDVKMAFQAMRDDSSLSASPADFDFDREENYSEGLSAFVRRQDSCTSVFHW